MRRALLAGLLCVCASAASAAGDDPTAIAKSVGEKFAKACGSADVKTVLSLYRDDARVVYPGAGETATDRETLTKMVTATCTADGPKFELVGYKAVWADAAHTVVAAYGDWQVVMKGADGKTSTAPVRATEVLAKTKGGWKYVVDHASIGVPPAP
jgi:ketosteroid isomerase-like protein